MILHSPMPLHRTFAVFTLHVTYTLQDPFPAAFTSHMASTLSNPVLLFYTAYKSGSNRIFLILCGSHPQRVNTGLYQKDPEN